MSELTKEQWEGLPDFVKSEYVEDGDGYSHKGFLKVKGTANELDARAKQTATELEEYRSKEAERIAAAEHKALEKARKEGNTEELEKRLREQLADAERRNGETQKQFEERLARMATKAKAAVASELAEIATDAGRAAFKRLIGNYIEVDPETDEVTYLDDDGRATSLSKDAFIAEINKNPVFAPLIKANVATSGGGGANGSNDSRAVSKPLKEMNDAERLKFKQRDPEGFRRALNQR